LGGIGLRLFREIKTCADGCGDKVGGDDSGGGIALALIATMTLSMRRWRKGKGRR